MEERYKKREHGIELDGLRDFIRQNGEEITYNSGDQLECEGEPARWWCIVEKGYFKYMTHGIGDGRKHTVWFSFEDEFMGDYPNLLDGSEAQFTIEAVVDSRAVRISGEQLEKFFGQNKEAERLGRRLDRHLLKQFQARYLDFHRATALERYKLLLQRCPGIIHDLSLQDIASFLNISPGYLSTIRKEITFSDKK